MLTNIILATVVCVCAPVLGTVAVGGWYFVREIAGIVRGK